MSIVSEFAKECFDDIGNEMGFVRSESYYYRIVNDIFLCYGFQSMGDHFRLIVVVSPLIAGISQSDDDRIVWFARRNSFPEGFSPGDYYYLRDPKTHEQMKKYYRKIILKIQPELSKINDLLKAYEVINKVTGVEGPYRRFMVPPMQEAIILYRLGKPQKAEKVDGLKYNPEIYRAILARDDEAINRIIASEFERSIEWLKKHRMCKNVDGGILAERQVSKRKRTVQAQDDGSVDTQG